MTDDRCPVCGEPYSHTVEEQPQQNVELRRDKVACRNQVEPERIKMYIHDSEPTVTRVRATDRDERSLLGRLFTDD